MDPTKSGATTSEFKVAVYAMPALGVLLLVLGLFLPLSAATADQKGQLFDYGLKLLGAGPAIYALTRPIVKSLQGFGILKNPPALADPANDVEAAKVVAAADAPK